MTLCSPYVSVMPYTPFVSVLLRTPIVAVLLCTIRVGAAILAIRVCDVLCSSFVFVVYIIRDCDAAHQSSTCTATPALCTLAALPPPWHPMPRVFTIHASHSGAWLRHSANTEWEGRTLPCIHCVAAPTRHPLTAFSTAACHRPALMPFPSHRGIALPSCHPPPMPSWQHPSLVSSPLPLRHRPPLMAWPSPQCMALPSWHRPPLMPSPFHHGNTLPSWHPPSLMSSPSPHGIALPSWHPPSLMASPSRHGIALPS